MSRRIVAKHFSTDLERTQCPGCLKSKVIDHTRLFRCKGCLQTRYCGTECQKAHWPTHRTLCLERQEIRRYPTYHDRAIVAEFGSAADPRTRPSFLTSELHQFQDHFKRLFYDAAMSGFNIHDEPNSWKENILWIKLSRCSVLPANGHSSPWWTRYMISHVEVLPLTLGNLTGKMLLTEEEARNAIRRKRTEDASFRGYSTRGISGTFWVSTQVFADPPNHGFIIECDCNIGFNLRRNKPPEPIDLSWQQTLIRRVNGIVAATWRHDFHGIFSVLVRWRHLGMVWPLL